MKDGNPRVAAFYERWSSPREQEAKIEALEAAVDAVFELIESSQGVYGLHLNGDPIEWGEMLEGGRYEEWLIELSKTR